MTRLSNSQSSIKLSASKFDNLQKLIARAETCLRAAGWSASEIEESLQNDLWDVFERRSAACPYEQERARLIVDRHYAEMQGEAFLVTFGNPLLRVLPDEIHKISVEAAFRHFRRARETLAREGVDVRGFANFELQECVPLKGHPFIEPHFHAILWGASWDELKSAFAFKVPDSVLIRRRALHTEPIDDLSGAKDYVMKLHPTRRMQYRRADGQLGWNPQRADSPDDPFVLAWYDFFGQHRMSEMLTSIGDELRDLRCVERWELAPPYRQKPAGWPKRGCR